MNYLLISMDENLYASTGQQQLTVVISTLKELHPCRNLQKRLLNKFLISGFLPPSNQLNTYLILNSTYLKTPDDANDEILKWIEKVSLSFCN